MGNNINEDNDTFYMNIQLIGSNMNKFIDNIKKSITNIEKLWDWNYEPLNNNININNQINDYFDKLEKIKDEYEENEELTKDIRETLIIKVNKIVDSEVSLIFERMEQLDETQYMPLVLILFEEESENELKIEEKYPRIDKRLIFIKKFSDDIESIKNQIGPILLRFCSIHNELGDRFTIGKNDKKEDFDLIEKYFPFNLNIACIGRFRQGKSTGVNAILKEYKAKESSKGCSQTKKLTFYQIKDQPVRLLDIPGFEDEDTVKEAVKLFQKCGEKINKIKDNLHIILYFLNYQANETFMKFEYPILEEITKHKSSKLIYVITHSEKDMNDNNKKRKIKNINLGMMKIIKDKPLYEEIKNNEMFKATEKNTVFVNFHNTKNSKIFGIKELFKKIHEFFIQSDDYKNSCKKLDKKTIEDNALKLRNQAKDILLSNKIWAGVVGCIPIVDLLVQKYYIKKNAMKKIGQIFGIDVELIDGEIEKSSKYADYIGPEIEHNTLNLEVNGEELVKEETSDKIIQGGSKTVGYVSSGISFGSSALKAAKASQLSADVVKIGTQVTQYTTQAAEFGAQAAELTKYAGDVEKSIPFGKYILSFFFPDIGSKAANLAMKSSSLNAAATNLASKATTIASEANALSTGANFLKVCGTTLSIGTCILGASLGVYFTHKYCEELLDKFENYYKKSAEKINNSYQQGALYFLLANYI